jgi:hypothetical protein
MKPPLQFSLTSLLLIVTLCAVLFASFAYSPCLGTLFVLLAAPAVLSTVIIVRHRQGAGSTEHRGSPQAISARSQQLGYIDPSRIRRLPMRQAGKPAPRLSPQSPRAVAALQNSSGTRWPVAEDLRMASITEATR